MYRYIYMYRYTKNQHEITPENRNLEKHHLPKPISNRVMLIFRGLPSPDPERQRMVEFPPLSS